MKGWESILAAHTSTLALCTDLKLEGNVSFTRSFCYDYINASVVGPIFPSPRWSIIEDCCLKFNRTVPSFPRFVSSPSLPPPHPPVHVRGSRNSPSQPRRSVMAKMLFSGLTNTPSAAKTQPRPTYLAIISKAAP